MLGRLFRGNRGARSVSAAIPEGQRVYAIGDIHGRLDLLEAMIAKIRSDDKKRSPAETQIILLGDLIDRGPASREVVELARKLVNGDHNVRCLAGNHEEVLLQAIAKPKAETARFFYRIGGRETLISYGLDDAEMWSMDFDLLARRLPFLVPSEHVDFLRSLEDIIVIGDYAFVHAGVKPGLTLDKQKPKHLRWIREEFLDHGEAFEKVIVYGHTISDEVQNLPNRIGLDTGAYSSGRLSAVGLEGSARWFLETFDEEESAAA